MQTRVPIIASNASLGELFSTNLAQSDGYTMFVMEDQDVVGVVTMRDVKKSTLENWSTITVREIMTPVADLLYVTADEDIADALERLQRLDMRHIPVMLNNRIVGLLHRKDVHRLLQLNSEFSS
jgi:CBS domain-containing protein